MRALICTRLRLARWPYRAGFLLAVGVLFGWSGPGWATDKEMVILTFSETLARVLQSSPELAAYPYEIRAAEARTLQAGVRPNPVVSVEVENVFGSGAMSGIEAVETTLALSQVIEMGNKRSLRQDVSSWQRQLVERDYELARLDVLAAAASRYLEVAQAQRLLDFSKQAIEWTLSAQAVAKRRFEAGSASRAELGRARTDAMRAALEVSNLEVRLANAKRRLASLWGGGEPDYSVVSAELFSLTKIPDFTSVRAQLDQAPQLQRFLSQSRLRQAQLDLAVASGRQDVELGAGFKHARETNDIGMVLQFSMPIGVNDKNRGNIQAAREDLARLDLEEQATRVKIFAELHSAYAQLEQSRHQVTVLLDEMLPEARETFELIQKGYEVGRFSYLELVQARQQVLAIENDAVVAATGFHQILITLESLTGQPLTRSGHTDAGDTVGVSARYRLPYLAEDAEQMRQGESP
ncbi:TolC family protein [Pseudomonas profundi]|uniref:TolC family protein n=1 Tax=Pseudomonas profundi TaxID=1981513 RepID=UPI00168179F3|nr:TolC family protein [Pseudomonas profundi]